MRESIFQFHFDSFHRIKNILLKHIRLRFFSSLTESCTMKIKVIKSVSNSLLFLNILCINGVQNPLDVVTNKNFHWTFREFPVEY